MHYFPLFLYLICSLHFRKKVEKDIFIVSKPVKSPESSYLCWFFEYKSNLASMFNIYCNVLIWANFVKLNSGWDKLNPWERVPLSISGAFPPREEKTLDTASNILNAVYYCWFSCYLDIHTSITNKLWILYF